MSLTPHDHLMRIIKIPATHAFWRNEFGFTREKLRHVCSGMTDWSKFTPWFENQPPALRACIENAPNAYELCTLQDVYERVPGDRLADCLNELRETMIALVASGKSFPWPMVWVDDCAPKAALEFLDAQKIARGCFDYLGGYTGEDDEAQLEAFRHGIQTVINSLDGAASRGGLKDYQVRVLHCIGSDQGCELAEFLAVEKVS